MRQWTTPTHTFQSDIDLTGVDVLFLTYKQQPQACCQVYKTMPPEVWDGLTTVLEKTKDDVIIEPDHIEVTLTQEETGLFKADRAVYIQCRVRFPDGTAPASNMITTGVEKVLKGGVI